MHFLVGALSQVQNHFQKRFFKSYLTTVQYFFVKCYNEYLKRKKKNISNFTMTYDKWSTFCHIHILKKNFTVSNLLQKHFLSHNFYCHNNKCKKKGSWIPGSRHSTGLMLGTFQLKGFTNYIYKVGVDWFTRKIACSLYPTS